MHIQCSCHPLNLGCSILVYQLLDEGKDLEQMLLIVLQSLRVAAFGFWAMEMKEVTNDRSSFMGALAWLHTNARFLPLNGDVANLPA